MKNEGRKTFINPFLVSKTARLKITEKILNANCPMGYGKAVAMIVYATGVSRNKAKEYLKTFIDLDSVKVENGEIVLIKTKKV